MYFIAVSAVGNFLKPNKLSFSYYNWHSDFSLMFRLVDTSLFAAASGAW
jgi:hypothetical protein